MKFSRASLGSALLVLALGCDQGGLPDTEHEPDASVEPGGSGGSGAGGARKGGATGQGTGGQGAGGDKGGAGGAGGATVADAAPSPDVQVGGLDGGGDGPPVSAAGQGPIAEGKIAFSQDFEVDMEGMTRSPNGLPEDRIQRVDDPLGQRGKVVRIHFMQGDNFRTSGGTEPRSWFSSAKGYTVRPGTKVSVAWGFMWENTSMGSHFAQIIRDGGPLWMFGVDQGGTVSAAVHRGSGRTGGMKLQPMKWYDFRVDTDYRGGGSIKFFINGQMVGQGTGAGGAPARFDCGIYWMHNAKPTRTVYVSNVSIGEF